MARVKIPYYVVKRGRGYFQPTKAMRQQGFQARCLGKDGPEAWTEAQRLYEDWLRLQRGERPVAEIGKAYPPGSVGHAFDRFRRMDAWKAKAPATRKKDWEWSWQFIEPIFGDIDPNTIEPEQIEALRLQVLETRGHHTAHRMMKTWRALWKVMASMRYCVKEEDPSKIIRNTAPRGRSETFKPGEVARIGKFAWRKGYRGLAVIVSVIWDTQFSPGDARKLKASELRRDARGLFFETSRAKTGQPVIGTLSRRTERLFTAYMERMGASPVGDAPLFRNRSGQPYSADTLGDDFRDVRRMVLPDDNRQMVDIRRTGAVEALAGEADPAMMSAKMGNSINHNRQLAETYLPRKAVTVRLVDDARRRGRTKLRGED
ncbi:hypothetical protein [Aestuariivirga sp.]|uniref:hypothetical protein n=1 Tax=Aestuariivirga sp. TaxID=2650926 RepID=UPI00391C6378